MEITEDFREPTRSEVGRRNRENGREFERRVEASLERLAELGAAYVTKNAEAVRILRNLGGGRYVVVYASNGEPDYKGVLRGGKCVVLEAKYSGTAKTAQSRVYPNQAAALERYAELGAKCYVLAGYADGSVYRVPWEVWREMKERFGRKYVTAADLKRYRVRLEDGIYYIFGGAK
jgi:recombination protein U